MFIYFSHFVVDRAEADAKGGIKQKRKFPQKLMVWLAVCSKGVSPLVIFESGTLNHDRYIREFLPVVLQYGNQMFGNDWTFQQDAAKSYIHEKTQAWCTKNIPAFIDKDRCILYFELFVLPIVLFNEILKMIITVFSNLYLILIWSDYYDNQLIPINSNSLSVKSIVKELK
jgi:hypothetical protein